MIENAVCVFIAVLEILTVAIVAGALFMHSPRVLDWLERLLR